jgi:hypothetical protein
LTEKQLLSPPGRWNSIEENNRVKPRKLALILFITVLLAAYYWLGMGYLKERSRNNTLSADIDETTLLLADIPTPAADPQERLEAVQAELDAALKTLPAKSNTTEIINSILQLADSTGIKIIPLQTSPWAIETYDDYNVAVYQLNLAITGKSGRFLDFLDSLENGDFPTLVIENSSVNKADETHLEDSLSESSTQIEAYLSIAIYAQAPAAEPGEEA